MEHEKLPKETTEAFQDMMKDLLFGEKGFFKDVPAVRKAAGIEIIDNTELVWLNKHTKGEKDGQTSKR